MEEIMKQFSLTVKDPGMVAQLRAMLAPEPDDAHKPDRLLLEWHYDKGAIEVAVSDAAGAQHRAKFTTAQLSIPVTFYDVPGGFGFMAGRQALTIELPDIELSELQAQLRQRNKEGGIETPAELYPDALSAGDYVIHTGQEIDILERSACDGRTGDNWRNEEQRKTRIYETKGASHRVELTIDDADQRLTLAALEKLTLSQDADFALAMLYVASVLAPPSPLPPNRYAGGWIDLDDVMEKIGWYPSKLSKAQAAEKRARLWRYLVYGDRARVVGARSSTYTNRATGEVMQTRIDSALWRILSVERPLQAALFDEVPLRAEVVISKEWEPLLTAPSLAQYLPLGALLGSIPPNKVAGDWARSIGLALAGLWRRNPREVQRGTMQPTRRELLTHYTPKTRTVEELLDGSDPRRAVQYWHDALGILVDQGLVARQSEATRTVTQMLHGLPSYKWGDAWLNARVAIAPGTKAEPLIAERAQALPPLQPKALPGQKRRARPPKKRPD